MTIKGLLLDLHGLLITNFPLKEYEKAVKEFLVKKGYEEGSYKRFKTCWGTITSAMEYHSLKEDYLKILDSLPVYSEKDDELVELLFNAPYELFLATDSSTENTTKTLAVAGISSGLFKMIVTGNDVKRGKPETEMYEKIVNAHPYINVKEWLVIGDRLTDIIPASKLGLKAILCDKDFLKEWLHASSKVCGEDSSVQVSK